MNHWQMQASPDVLITPSKLTPMAKDVHGTLVVNPSTLGKGNKTYAQLTIHPMKEDTIRDALIANKTSIPHDIVNRTKVSIVKI